MTISLDWLFKTCSTVHTCHPVVHIFILLVNGYRPHHCNISNRVTFIYIDSSYEHEYRTKSVVLFQIKHQVLADIAYCVTSLSGVMTFFSYQGTEPSKKQTCLYNFKLLDTFVKLYICKYRNKQCVLQYGIKGKFVLISKTSQTFLQKLYWPCTYGALSTRSEESMARLK